MATNVQRAEHSAARLGRGSQSQKSDVGWCPDKGDGSPYRQEVALERQVPISNQVLEFYPCFTCLPPSGLFLFGDLHVFIHGRGPLLPVLITLLSVILDHLDTQGCQPKPTLKTLQLHLLLLSQACA